MSAELQRMSTFLLGRLGFSPRQAQEFARVMAGAGGRQRKNNSLNPTGQPLATDDIKLVAIDGGTTLKKGDEVSTNRSKQLVRPPKQSNHGGLQVVTTVRVEQERQRYYGVVVEQLDTDLYTCRLLDRDPPTRLEAKTGQDTTQDQDDANDGAGGELVTVKVYGQPESFTYNEGDKIDIQAVRSWKVRQTNQTRMADRAREAVISRSAVRSSPKYYNIRYQTGGGE